MADIVAETVTTVLRVLHIAFGVAWIGAVFFSVGVLRTVLPRVGIEARKEFLRQFIPVSLRYVPMVAVMTIISGVALLLWSARADLSAILFETEWGRIILGSLGLTIATFTYGALAVMRPGKAIQKHLEEEVCEHAQEVGALQRKFGMGQIVVLVLGIAIIVMMVLAR